MSETVWFLPFLVHMIPKLPPISVSFDENKKRGFLPFLSPREKSSGYSHASPRVQMDPKSDSLLQRTVETVWLSLLKQIEKADPGQEKCVLSIPFSQGLLFGELLWAHRTKADRSGKFTVILNDRLAEMNRNSSDELSHISHKKETSSRRSSTSDLRERITHARESPDYLQKFLEISKLMLQCKKERNKSFTVTAAGFDREFFKTALFHYYPAYIDSIASKHKQFDPGLLQVSMKRGVRDVDELKQKIDRLKSLVDRMSQTSSRVFPPPFCYQNPANLLSHPHFLSRKKTPPTESGPSNWMPKEEMRVFRVSSEEIETGRPLFRRADPDGDDLGLGTPYSPSSLQEKTELDVLSDCELSPESQLEQINRMAQQLTDLVMLKLGGRMPKTTQSDNWKHLWNSIEEPGQPKLNQSKIRELVSLKCELAKTSFALIPYLNDHQKEKCLSKTAQMRWIEDSQIERSIYPPDARAPIANIFVNGRKLISEPAEWTRELSLNYFKALLSELLSLQQQYSPQEAEQHLAGLFDFTNLQIHPNPIQKISIVSMLKASTFGFGANVFWILKSFFPEKDHYEIFETKNYKPSYEFFTDASEDCTSVRTAAFTLWRVKSHSEPKEELGIFVTKLISSFSAKSGKWSFRVEIPRFEPSPLCSLREQREIHRKLLEKRIY